MAGTDAERRERFEAWLAEMASSLDRFLASFSPELRARLDFSPASLNVLEAWLLSRYASNAELQKELEIPNLDGSARYIGQTMINALGGHWELSLDDPQKLFYGLPTVTGFSEKPIAKCPQTLATEAVKRRTGKFLSTVVANAISQQAKAGRSYRFKDVDRAWLDGLLINFSGYLAKARQDIAQGEARLLQSAQMSVHRSADTMARLRFATNEPVSSIRDLLSESAAAYLAVQRDEASHWGRSHSGHSLNALYVTSAIGSLDLARAIAEVTWDPPDSNIIAPDSVVCTTAEQHLAYAVKGIILDDLEMAATEAKLARTTREDLQLQVAMVHALLRRTQAEFLEALVKLLAWNRRLARSSQRQPRIERVWSPPTPDLGFLKTDPLLCMPALGLAGLALRMKLLRVQDLPSDPHFPHELLLAVNASGGA